MSEISIEQTNNMICAAISKIRLKRQQELIMRELIMREAKARIGKWEDMSPYGYDFYRAMMKNAGWLR